MAIPAMASKTAVEEENWKTLCITIFTSSKNRNASNLQVPDHSPEKVRTAFGTA